MEFKKLNLLTQLQQMRAKVAQARICLEAIEKECKEDRILVGARSVKRKTPIFKASLESSTAIKSK